MKTLKIDLYSDTITRPTAGMREYMAKAEVGDEQKREDPTTNRLVAMVAELLGKEDAVFLPSGTMRNQIAVRIHCRQGDEIIMDRLAHVRNSEAGGAAALSGAAINPIDGARGVFTTAQLLAAIRPPVYHSPPSRVVWIEQTANGAGGVIWPLENVQEICATAKANGMACHMDGARLLNAAVETGIPASEWAAPFDSLWIDFSKGLGAPVGAALAGSREFIKEAWRWKHQFGGAMRQSGIIAAGAVYALEHHVDRLAEDHANAKHLADGIGSVEGLEVEPAITNMVFINIASLGITAQDFNLRLMERGLRLSIFNATRLRAVTHLDVSAPQIEEAIEIIRDVAGSLPA
jgi:threonine aldolase